MNAKLELKYFKFPKYWEPWVEPILDSDHLWERLDQIWKEYSPTDQELIAITLVREGRSSLKIGFSNGEWILIFEKESGVFWCAIGDPTTVGDRWVVFPEWTELPRRFVLTSDVAKGAIRYWIDTGEPSPMVDWQQ